MNNKRIKKISKTSIWIASILISLQSTLGMILGYFLAKKLSGEKTGEQGRLKSLGFNFGNYKLHFHHWFLGVAIFIASYFLDISFSSHPIFFGGIGGMVVHGVFDYHDWHKVIAKKNK
ncbi:MAG TPA: hypothetical protein ENH06_00555 [bacterium]|nr:hypothetical protein [bacterium]